jgi:hypothetical protein
MSARKMLLFTGVLLLVVGLRYAFAQDQGVAVGWDTDAYQDPLDIVLALMIAAPILGAVFGAIRVLSSRSARPVLEPIRLN